MMKETLNDAERRMDASVTDGGHKLAAIRTGRASLAMFERVSVDYYGTPTPLNKAAKLSIPEPSMIIAQPFDPSMIGQIERAILSSDLGLNPSNAGKLIRIPVPPLTEERRKQLVKKVHSLGEETKTAIRQVRRDANEHIKKAQKDKECSEDDAHRALDEIQKKTDAHVAKVDEFCKNKETELMEV